MDLYTIYHQLHLSTDRNADLHFKPLPNCLTTDDGRWGGGTAYSSCIVHSLLGTLEANGLRAKDQYTTARQ